jgi:4-oxalmesaconate hydratase
MLNGNTMLNSSAGGRMLPCGCYGPADGMFAAAVSSAASGAGTSPVNIEASSNPQSKRTSAPYSGLVIDCHGHYTTEPPELSAWRKQQIDAIGDPSQMPKPDALEISDDQLRQSVEGAQLRLQRERGTSVTIFSPRASAMGHHIGDAAVSGAWSRVSNDLIFRLTKLYPKNFIGVCQLPQSPGVEPKNCIPELERCVNELGFVGCNLNPDPAGGYWKDPPLTDKWWYPLYEKMVELNVPAMVHVTASANRAFHTTGSHYINGDTTAFMQFLLSDIFKDFPTLKFIIPHGGGAVPYHWGRYRGIAQDQKRPPLSELLLNNVFFDTCVYHQPGIDLLTKVIPAKNILFASEMVGAVKGIDPETGHFFDDTKRYIDQSAALNEADKTAIFENNARAVYGRLSQRLQLN